MEHQQLPINPDNEFIYKDILHNFIRLLPFDIISFLFISFIITSIIRGLELSNKLYQHNVFYFILLLTSYIIYYIKIRPIISRHWYSDWFYFTEKTKDNALVKMQSLARRIIFLKWSPKRHVHMVMGELNSVLWNSRYFVDSIDQLLSKDIDLQVIIKNHVDVETKEVLRMAVEQRIKIYFVDEDLVNKYTKGHFIVTDRKGLWLSDKHPRFVLDKEGRYSFGPSLLSNEKEKMFELLRDKGTLLSLNTINEINFIIHDCGGAHYRPATSLEIENLLEYISACAMPLKN